MVEKAVKCPRCGKDNPDYSVYCGACASELPKAPPPENTGPQTCSRCKAKNPAGQKFCGECGTDLSEGPIDPPAFPDKEEGPGWLEEGSTSYWLMTFDWKLRWAMMAVVGIIMGLIFTGVAATSNGPDLWGFAVLFLVVGILGAIVTALNLSK